MLSSTFHVLLILATFTSYAAIARRVDERIGGVFALGLWGVTAAAALNHEVAVGESLVSVSAPGVAILATGGAAVMLVFTFAAVTGRLVSIDGTRY